MGRPDHPRIPAIRRLLLLGLIFVFSPTIADQYHWTGVDRIVAFGDLHGDYQQYQKLLRQNGLIDDRLRWSGGNTHLVQLGDVPDRGAESSRIIRHLMRLQREARRAGGAVHTLVGNHEAMNIFGHLDYVHPGEYSALITPRSSRLQRDYLQKVVAQRLRNDPSLGGDRDGLMAKLEKQYPLGYVEHRVLWQPGGELARWVAGNPAVIRINRNLFCHGGIDPNGELKSIEAINAEIAAALRAGAADPEGLAEKVDGPLWYRGLAVDGAEVDSANIDRMLKFHDVDRIVIAHTPSPGKIAVRFEGRVIVADTGISAFYGGHAVNLVIDDDTLYSQSPAGRELLPVRSQPEGDNH